MKSKSTNKPAAQSEEASQVPAALGKLYQTLKETLRNIPLSELLGFFAGPAAPERPLKFKHSDPGAQLDRIKSPVIAGSEHKEFEVTAETEISDISPLTPLEILPVSCDLHKQLDMLEFSAMAGCATAIDNLRMLGVRIADFLADLAGSPDDEIQKNIDNEPTFFPEEHPDDACNFDRTSALRELANLTAKLKSYQTGELAALLKVARKSDEPVLWVDLEFKYFFALLESNSQIETDSADSTPISRDLQTAIAETAAIEKQWQIEDIILWSIGRRLTHVSRRTVRRVLGKSHEWPIRTIALADGRAKKTESYVSTLGLGSSTGIKFTPRQGSGGTRKFGKGSCLYFTIDVVLELDEQRIRGASMCTSHRQEYAEAEKQSKSADGLPVGSKWNTSNHWTRKACLLPEPRIEHLEKWLDAAMSMLAAQCKGDFEGRSWPAIVDKRTRYTTSGNRGESREAALRETIKAGLEQILAS